MVLCCCAVLLYARGFQGNLRLSVGGPSHSLPTLVEDHLLSMRAPVLLFSSLLRSLHVFLHSRYCSLTRLFVLRLIRYGGSSPVVIVVVASRFVLFQRLDFSGIQEARACGHNSKCVSKRALDRPFDGTCGCLC